MLRSTFTAYNEAHPDKPLINPRNAAAGTVRAKDPKAVEGRRLQFFAFDLDTEGEVHDDLEAGLKALGFDAADMRHTDTAKQAQETIAEDRGDPQRARLRPRRRRPAARRPHGLRRRRHALQLAARGARVQVRRRGEDDDPRRRHLGRRQDRQGRARRRARARVRRRHDRHARHARQPGGDPRARRADRRHGARAPRRRRDPVRGRRARRGQAHGRRAGDRPAVERARPAATTLTEQGNSRELYCTNVACPAQTVRRLIHWASRAAADIDAIGQKWIERLNEAGRLERASDFYALDKETLLEFDRIGEVSRPEHDRLDRAQQGRRAAQGADRLRDPDGLRGHRGQALPRTASRASRPSPTRARRSSSRSRTSARRSPRACTSTSTARARARRSPRCASAA